MAVLSRTAVFSDLIFRLRAVLQRRKVEAELDDELREHYGESTSTSRSSWSEMIGDNQF
jgi:hypothetical protein